MSYVKCWIGLTWYIGFSFETDYNVLPIKKTKGKPDIILSKLLKDNKSGDRRASSYKYNLIYLEWDMYSTTLCIQASWDKYSSSFIRVSWARRLV